MAECASVDGKDRRIPTGLEALEGRLDDHIAIYSRHVQIYADNGKESKRVADILEKMVERSVERDAKVDKMYKEHMDKEAVGDAVNRFAMLIIKVAAVLAAFAGIGAAFKWFLK